MKRIIFSLSIVALAFAGCECKHGYGPNECESSWASNYAGNWHGEAICNGQTFTGQSTITEESATRIRIDGNIYGELSEWNSFEVPEQYFLENGQQVSISGSGTLREENEVASGGAMVSRKMVLRFSMQRNDNAGVTACTFTLER